MKITTQKIMTPIHLHMKRLEGLKTLLTRMEANLEKAAYKASDDYKDGAQRLRREIYFYEKEINDTKNANGFHRERFILWPQTLEKLHMGVRGGIVESMMVQSAHYGSQVINGRSYALGSSIW